MANIPDSTPPNNDSGEATHSGGTDTSLLTPADRSIRDGIRSRKQRRKHPYGRTRLQLAREGSPDQDALDVQLVGNSTTQGEILDFLTKLPRNGKRSRHIMIWRILEAGWRALTETKSLSSTDAAAVAADHKGEKE